MKTFFKIKTLFLSVLDGSNILSQIRFSLFFRFSLKTTDQFTRILNKTGILPFLWICPFKCKKTWKITPYLCAFSRWRMLKDCLRLSFFRTIWPDYICVTKGSNNPERTSEECAGSAGGKDPDPGLVWERHQASRTDEQMGFEGGEHRWRWTLSSSNWWFLPVPAL